MSLSAEEQTKFEFDLGQQGFDAWYNFDKDYQKLLKIMSKLWVSKGDPEADKRKRREARLANLKPASREIAPGEKLASRQVIQHWIADSRTEIDASRLMVLHAGWKIDQLGAKEARTEVSSIKYYVANVMMKVIDRAIQIHGAQGISDDTILSYFYRNERASRIYDGPDEVHRNVVARRVLREYGYSTR